MRTNNLPEPSVRHPWRGFRPFQRHGLVLLVAGCVYIGVGLSFIGSEQLHSRIVALHYAILWLPIQGWGGVFIISGLLAIISSRWPPVTRTWGYTILTGLSAGWAMFYLVGIGFHHSPISNITGALTWGLIAFLWWAISGLINPDGGKD